MHVGHACQLAGNDAFVIAVRAVFWVDNAIKEGPVLISVYLVELHLLSEVVLLQRQDCNLVIWNNGHILVLLIKDYPLAFLVLLVIELPFKRWLLIIYVLEALINVLRVEDVQGLLSLDVNGEPITCLW